MPDELAVAPAGVHLASNADRPGLYSWKRGYQHRIRETAGTRTEQRRLIRSADRQKHAVVARGSSALIIRGRVERACDVTNLVADNLERLPLAATTRSRDFR
jgi:hypothetical protein